MERRVVEVVLPNGARALVRAVDEDAAGGGAVKTAAREEFDFGEVERTLEGLSSAVRSAVAKATPDRVTVEFNLELAVKSGRLTGLLVEGQAAASLKVTLEWYGCSLGWCAYRPPTPDGTCPASRGSLGVSPSTAYNATATASSKCSRPSPETCGLRGCTTTSPAHLRKPIPTLLAPSNRATCEQL